MKKKELHVGLFSLVRPTFDTSLAAQLTEELAETLRYKGFTLTQGDEALSTVEQVEVAVQAFVKKPLDVVIVFQSSFADSSMVVRIAELIDAPMILWAVPELPNGERLRLNSLCGVNLAAHALRRVGHHYATIYAQPNDPSALNIVHTTALAGCARRLLRAAKIGRVGENPPGFASCLMNPEALRNRLGVEVVQFELEEIFGLVRAVEPHVVDTVYSTWASQIEGLDALDQTSLRRTMATFVALHELAQTQKLNGLAVRCWFQFVEELGCAVCGAQCMLSEMFLPASCEADVNGTVTQLILQSISGQPSFDSDIVSFDMDANTAVFWHCGKAPLSMADPETSPRAVEHFNFKKPMALEFALKPGRVTFARLSEATGDYRLVIGGGEIIRAPISFSGTSGVVRFDRPAQKVLDTILGEGLEHHLALVYGDWIDPLLVLAQMLDMPVLQLS